LRADFYARDEYVDTLWTGDLNVTSSEPVTKSFLTQEDTFVTLLGSEPELRQCAHPERASAG